MSQESSGLGDNTLKVLTFAGPLLASSLAITYDVGFFVGIGIGFFSFFSLSEHLVFALQSLPFAIPPVAVLLLWSTTGWYGYRLRHRDGTVSSEDTEPKLNKLGSVAISCIEFMRARLWFQRLWIGMIILSVLIDAWRGQYAIAFLLACLLIYLAKTPDLHAAWKSRSPVLMVACAVAALILSFLVGFQRANAVLTSQSTSEMIGVDEKLLPARLIRGGDKGILFFSLDSKKVRFLRWDSIKQIEML